MGVTAKVRIQNQRVILLFLINIWGFANFFLILYLILYISNCFILKQMIDYEQRFKKSGHSSCSS